jgi:hypothetical protein
MGNGLLEMVRPKLGLRTLAPLAASLAMGIVVCVLRGMNLFGCIGFGALTYSVLLLLLKGITPEDIGLARNA